MTAERPTPIYVTVPSCLHTFVAHPATPSGEIMQEVAIAAHAHRYPGPGPPGLPETSSVRQ
jgi:hypothetical protein